MRTRVTWLLALTLANCSTWTLASPPIRAQIQASWDAAPLLIQMIETAALEEPSKVFELVSSLISRPGLVSVNSSSTETYSSFLSFLKDGKFLSAPGELDSWKLSLAAKEASPKIEAGWSLWGSRDVRVKQNETGVQEETGNSEKREDGSPEGCESWVEWYGKQICSLSELHRLLGDPSHEVHEPLPTFPGAIPCIFRNYTGFKTYPFDHVHIPTSRAPDPTYPLPSAILYLDPSSPNGRDLHETLLDLSKQRRVRYVLRWAKPQSIRSRRLILSGYGAGLDIKKADYLAIDDRNVGGEDAGRSGESKVVSKAATTSDGEVDPLDDRAEGIVKDIKPLTAAQISDIGVKAVQYIKQSSNPLQTLVRLAQDFPKHAHKLVTQLVPDDEIDEELLSEISRNQLTKIEGGKNAIWINGLLLEESDVDPFSLLRMLRKERQRIQSLVSLELTPPQAISLISHPVVSEAAATGAAPNGLMTAEALGEIFDASDRSEGGGLTLWWNDLQKDKRYKRWPKSVYDLLRPTYPGQMVSLARNLWNVVLYLDLSQTSSHKLISETVTAFIQRGLPIRFGLIPDTSDRAGKIGEWAARLLWYIVSEVGRSEAMNFLGALAASEEKTVSQSYLTTIYERIRMQSATKSGEPLLPFDDVVAGPGRVFEISSTQWNKARAYAKRLGLNGGIEAGNVGSFFFNGQHNAVDDEFQRNIQALLSTQMQFVQQQVYLRNVADDTDIDNLFYDLPSSHKGRHPLIFPAPETNPLRIVDLVKVFKEAEFDYARDAFVYSVPQPDEAEGVEPTYFTVWIVADFATEDGVSLATEALEFLISNPHRRTGRVAFVHAPSRRHEGPKTFLDLLRSSHLETIPPAQLIQSLGSTKAEPLEDSFWSGGKRFATAVGLKDGEKGIVINGRVLVLPHGSSFTASDFGNLATYEVKKRVGPVVDAFNDTLPFDSADARTFRRRADLYAAAGSIISAAYVADPALGMFHSGSVQRGRVYRAIEGNYTSLAMGNEESSFFQIGVVLDPVSETAQKWAAIVKTLSELPSVALQVYLNPTRHLTELPIKRFYRLSFPSELSFDANGLEITPAVDFQRMPESVLLTFAVDTKHSWLAFPKETLHDLDNIRLSDLSTTSRENGIEALFELENIIVEGHAREMPSGAPPRGLQLVLSNAAQDRLQTTDTIVMANLGYFQLKANPGVWQLDLREGASSRIFDIESVGASGWRSDNVEKTGKNIAMTTFEGLTTYPRFRRKKGMEQADLLETDVVTSEGLASGWRALVNQAKSLLSKTLGSNSWTGSALRKSAGAEINIFTVASGLLYERMAFIMIISVLRHTKSTVKFWFIQNFLSPSFKAFIPHMAREYGFEYELVTYKWPHWLRAQKEKQRTIWGYKILFLDVLFPLELERVIFVDSDQIVRTDLKQLADMDLQGAPYGYAPMGNDRKEMEGFRFWKTGYWAEHLEGRPYHISALYVVDLDRFRRIAAGDRLRGQYQGLSSDPNSLANLDQDLPNNMWREIPIFTLDQSWLWCETWCSDESLKVAKTIDLCNNPMTHEPKLDRARRLIPEWTEYDKEVAALAKRVASDSALSQEAGNLEQARMQVKDYIETGEQAKRQEGGSEEKEVEKNKEEDTAGHVKDEL